MRDLRSKFLDVFQVLKSELFDDPAFEVIDFSRQWVDNTFTLELKNYIEDSQNPGGTLNRGFSVLDCYKFLKEEGKELTDDEFFLASALQCCINWAFFLELDDILDKPHTRQDQDCWFKDPKVCMFAANNGVILRQRIPRVLRKHFRDKKYYVDLLDLFDQVEFQTAGGQMNNLLITIEDEKDLSKYSFDLYGRIVHYKTANYSFYLTVICALLMSGEKLEDHLNTKSILIDMEKYLQVQIEYHDCFGDPQSGKTGTDIEDFKCSWLVVKALELCDNEQKNVLHENYGKQDPACVARVKQLYNELNLQCVFAEYESQNYENLITSIEACHSAAVQALLKSLLAEVYKSQN